jgi:hypothetical protein
MIPKCFVILRNFVCFDVEEINYLFNLFTMFDTHKSIMLLQLTK